MLGLLGGLERGPGRRRDGGTWTSARIRPVGREQQRAAGATGVEPGDVGRQEIVEPGDGVGAPTRDLAPVGQVDERAPVRAARPGLRDGTVVGHPPRRALWDYRHPWTIPSTLLVTNDFPPRVGGIQRTLEALWRELPADRVGGVRAPWEGAERLRRGRSRSVCSDSRERFLWPHRGVADRLEAVARATGAEVVLFGDAFPLALLGPRLAARGLPYRAPRTGSSTGSRPRRARMPCCDATTGPRARVAVCAAFIARTVRTAVPREVPVSVLYPGADVERVPTRPRDRRHPGAHGLGGRPLIVCVSRLVPRKGQDMLIARCGDPPAGSRGRAC